MMSDDTRQIIDALQALERAQSVSLDRIAARLTTLEGVMLGSIGPPRDPGALARIDDVEREVRSMREEQQWLRRTLIASIIGGAIAIIGSLIVAATRIGG